MSEAREAELREELATATRILGRHEMMGMFGHISSLTDDPEKYLICPGMGRRKDQVRPEDLYELGLDDEFEVGLPLELYMHAAMHRANPEIKSLVHVHSPNLTALASIKEVPSDLLMIHASFWPEEMPVWDRPELVDSHADGRDMVEILGDDEMMLLRWHGAVIVGKTVKEAVFRTILAEYHAGQVLTALAHGLPLATVQTDRKALYDAVLPPVTHEMSFRFESSYVELDQGAEGHAHPRS